MKSKFMGVQISKRLLLSKPKYYICYTLMFFLHAVNVPKYICMPQMSWKSIFNRGTKMAFVGYDCTLDVTLYALIGDNYMCNCGKP